MASKAIDKFRDEKNNIIYFDQLKDIPLNEEKDINLDRPGSVLTSRIKSSGKDLSFRVNMKKGEKWNIHSHDCNETILMYEGIIVDTITNKTITRLQTIFIPKFQDHEVIALEDSIFYVEFKNPH